MTASADEDARKKPAYPSLVSMHTCTVIVEVCMEAPQKLETQLAFEPATSFLSTYPRTLYEHTTEILVSSYSIHNRQKIEPTLVASNR